MTTKTSPKKTPPTQRLNALKKRFRQLAAVHSDQSDLPEGLDALAAALEQILKQLTSSNDAHEPGGLHESADPQKAADQTASPDPNASAKKYNAPDAARLQLLGIGLTGIADVLEHLIDESDSAFRSEKQADSDSSVDPPVHRAANKIQPDPGSRFREMFRADARQRLLKFALTLPRIISRQPAGDIQADLEEGGAQLHAIRGSAAMVGLGKLAELARAMELVVDEIKNAPTPERAWPARALMRGFHLLEDALEHDQLELDQSRSAETIGLLCAYLSPADDEQALAVERPADLLPREQPAALSPREKPADLSPREKPADLSPREKPADLSPRQQPAGFTPRAQPPGPHKRILVVDDIDTVAASVGFVLAELGVPIDTASNGAQALEMLYARPYSLVVSDVDMPRMDGVALTRILRQDPATRELPVILLTSLDRPDERDAGIEAGATDYVIKGAIGGGELVGRVRELLRLAPDVPFGAQDRPRTQLRVLIAEDVETIAASIAFVLADGPFEIDIARDGRAALERLQKEAFDLLLSDVEMPEMGGLELLEAVRNDDRLVDLPVILLTSLQDPAIEQAALNVGADRFLIKGDVGADTLRQILVEAAQARARRAQMQVIELDSPALTPLNVDPLKQ